VSKWRVDGYYLRIDMNPDGAMASLFDMDDTREEMPIAEATAATADAAVAELISTVTFDVTEEDA
jgi:hypothetical protein